MTTQANNVVILRDGEGNFYLISADVVQSGRVPAEKAEALRNALAGDVGGFLFDVGVQNLGQNFQQSNFNAGANTIVGGLAAFNTQALSQTGINIGSQTGSQAQRV